MIGRLNQWINTVNTTSFRILASVFVFVVGTLMVLTAVLFFDFEPSEVQMKVLLGMGLGVIGFAGLDVTQFAFKRFSAEEYQRGKNPSPVTVEAPSTVKIDNRTGGSQRDDPEPGAPEIPPRDSDAPPGALRGRARESERGEE